MNTNSPFNSFIEIYQQHHSANHPSKQTDKVFVELENTFLSIFQLGLFETYNFLYNDCKSTADFKRWIIALKGESFFSAAESQFNQWKKSEVKSVFTSNTLTTEQHAFWQQHGYLKIEGLISETDCDAVSTLICNTLGVNVQDEGSWYPKHEKLQGLMLQLYQDSAIACIRNNDQVKAVFAALYDNENILPNAEKVSYNPPVTEQYTFKGSPLHWDINFNIGPRYYIQGLLYLNDVPADRGAFTLIPGFHHQIKDFLQGHETAEMAMNALRNKGLEQPVAGKKGDLIVWLESLPHAASPNYSNLPRFVQYVSFNPD